MKTTLLSSLAIVAAIASSAFAQSYSGSTGVTTQPVYSSYGYSSGWYGASTIAEGYYRGIADLTRAAGEYNYNTSLATINQQEAVRRYNDNRVQSVRAYFEMRRINTEARANEYHVPTPEEARAMAKMGVPQRPSAQQYEPVLGTINWPAALLGNEFAGARSALDNLMTRRELTSGVGSGNYRDVAAATTYMQEILKSKVELLSPTEYVQAKKFLESLKYEAQSPPAAAGIAVN